jgi:hypothetical protein
MLFLPNDWWLRLDATTERGRRRAVAGPPPCYGLTKQGAQQRFRAVRNKDKAADAASPAAKAETVA